MRACAILTALSLAAGPALADSFSKGTLGFALGTKKADGTCKAQSDYEQDFDAISSQSGSSIVRGYAASDCNCAQNILPAAQSKGFRVILGVWPDTDQSYAADKSAITTYAPQYPNQVYAVTVGSETLYRGNFTGEQLLAKINDMKAAVPGVKVGTADSWNKWADGTGDAVIQGGVDLIMGNAFSYWQGKGIDSGALYTYFDDVQQALGHVQQVAGSTSSIEFWNGETGWPTDGGTSYGGASAGTANAASFYTSGV